MATGSELVSTHMPKKLRVENWLHECQLLASVMLPLGGTVYHYSPWLPLLISLFVFHISLFMECHTFFTT